MLFADLWIKDLLIFNLDNVHKKYYDILKSNFDKVIRDCEEELARVKVMCENLLKTPVEIAF